MGRKGGSGLSTAALTSKLDKAGFVKTANGQWNLDTGMGGGIILDESDDYKYGGKAYSAKAWDSNYDVIGDTEIYSDLNAAKAAIKAKIKSTL